MRSSMFCLARRIWPFISSKVPSPVATRRLANCWVSRAMSSLKDWRSVSLMGELILPAAASSEFAVCLAVAMKISFVIGSCPNRGENELRLCDELLQPLSVTPIACSQQLARLGEAAAGEHSPIRKEGTALLRRRSYAHARGKTVQNCSHQARGKKPGHCTTPMLPCRGVQFYTDSRRPTGAPCHRPESPWQADAAYRSNSGARPAVGRRRWRLNCRDATANAHRKGARHEAATIERGTAK